MIVCIGEILIDFVALNRGQLEDVVSFSRNAGGAPANVAVWLAALGQAVSFVGAVGNDGFGRYLRSALAERGVDTGQIQRQAGAATTLAFVSLSAAGERDFEFVAGADALLELTEGAALAISHAHALHFGSVSLSREPARNATWQAVETARNGGAIINFDPNIRPNLWPRPQEIAEQCWRGIRAADIVKLNDDEAAELTGQQEPAAALDALASYLGAQERPSLIALTCGSSGSLYLHRPSGLRGQVPSHPVARVVDSTGAGDAFTAALLDRILHSGQSPATLTESTIVKAIQQASIAGARAITQRGAWPRRKQ